ncbi:hexose kinase [Halosimplex aquaticum]|uniref:Hexose kinase n=1 Tax=Halosimplex aquaticum TaxID=3026162 RepID=A0ABD5Y2E6_9EURY|nr:hexose kinase [Halosimplex aquaticum]
MILTVTLNPAVDHTIEVAGSLRTCEVTRTERSHFDAGGKGINVSKFLAALDVETVATGLVGGFTGEYVCDELTRAGVEHDFVETDQPTRLNTTLLTDDGEYKLNQSGTDVGSREIEAVVSVVAARDPDTVVVAGSLPPGLGASAIDAIARAGDWQTVVDVTGSVLGDLSAEYSFCTPNRHELAAATGCATESTEECRTAARRLLDDGFDHVVVTMGETGAMLVGPDDAVHIDPADVSVVDTAGAGDALLAGLLAADDGGADLETALETGVSTAEAVIGIPGTGNATRLDYDGR